MARRPKAGYDLEARDRTDRGLRQAEQRLRGFGGRVGGMLRGVGAKLAGPLAAIGTAIGSISTATIAASKTLRELDQMGNLIDLTADEMQMLSAVADQLGTDMKTAGEVVQELRSKGLEAIQEPSGRVAKMFSELNINAEKFVKLDVPNTLWQTAQAVADVDDAARRGEFMRGLVGETLEDQRLIADPDALRRAIQNTADTGTMLEDAAEQATKTAGAWDRLMNAFGLVGQAVSKHTGRYIAPVLTGTAEALENIATGRLDGPVRTPGPELTRTALGPGRPNRAEEEMVVLQREIVRLLDPRRRGLN